MMKLRMKYFAQLREQLGCEQEDLMVGEPVAVASLIEQLRGRGGDWAQVLSGQERICVAVDQQMVPLSHELRGDAEVALFRPVTGG